MPKSKPVRTSVAPALDRGLTILESLSQTRNALTLTQIATRVGLSVSEIQRIVTVLRERSYLIRDDGGAYRLSSKLFRIASSYPPFRDLAARALPAMQAFVDETSESVHLSVLSEDQLLIVASVEGRGLVRLTLQPGTTQPPHGTVSGRALLAHLPPADFDSALVRLRLVGAAQVELGRRCAAIRKRGFEHAQSELLEGIEDLGVVIQLPEGTPLAALTTSWLPRKRPAGKSASAASKPPTAKAPALLRALRKAAKRIANSYERSD